MDAITFIESREMLQKTKGGKYVLYPKDLEVLLNGFLMVQAEESEDPYWYWPQCDVDGCDGVSSNGGNCWRETGYWSVCDVHSQQHRDGNPQPKMKQSAIDRENGRNKKTGFLPQNTSK